MLYKIEIFVDANQRCLVLDKILDVEGLICLSSRSFNLSVISCYSFVVDSLPE